VVKRPGPIQRIVTVVYLSFATAIALAGLGCVLFTVVLFVQWSVEAALP
jgi:hypothetical protein